MTRGPGPRLAERGTRLFSTASEPNGGALERGAQEQQVPPCPRPPSAPAQRGAARRAPATPPRPSRVARRDLSKFGCARRLPASGADDGHPAAGGATRAPSSRRSTRPAPRWHRPHGAAQSLPARACPAARRRAFPPWPAGRPTLTARRARPRRRRPGAARRKARPRPSASPSSPRARLRPPGAPKAALRAAYSPWCEA